MTEFLEGLFTSSVSGTIITALLFLTKPLVKNRISHKIQYFSWYLVFIRLLLPFSFSVFLFGNLIPFEDVRSVQSSVGTVMTGSLCSSSSDIVSQITSAGKSQFTGIAQMTHTGNFSQNDWSVLLFLLWILGALIMFMLNAAGYFGYCRRIRLSRKQANNMETLALLKECGAKLKLSRTPPVCISACTDTPMLIGLFKCCIVLPNMNFSPEQLRHALMHELVHYRRHDNLLKWISVLSVCVEWFNPAVYFAVREAGRQCELACDETVTDGYSRDECIRYGRTLLAVAAKSHRQSLALPATMSEDKRILKERLQVLTTTKSRGKKVVALSVFLCSIVVLITAITLMVSYAPKTASSKSADTSSQTGIKILGFGPIEQSLPVKLPSATQYPKPSFSGTVTQISPAWRTQSIMPVSDAHICPDVPQSLPVNNFTITQCWKGEVQGNEFVLQTYCNFNLLKGQSSGGDCYIALKTGNKVYVSPIDKAEILVNFCGPMVVFIRCAMSYDLTVIDLRNGSMVEADSDKMRSLASVQPYDPDHVPSIPTQVMGISKNIASYPVSQISASAPNPFLGDKKDSQVWKEAWEHRIGRQ